MASEESIVVRTQNGTRNGCVLFLEDEEKDAQPWITWFTEKGWDVFWFRNAEDAINHLDEDGRWDQIDIAVLDQRIHDHPIQGLEFADLIYSERKSFARCVVLTGHKDAIPDAERDRRLRSGQIVNLYSKSVEKQELLERLVELQDTANRLRAVRRLERERAAYLEKGLTNIHGDELKATDKRVLRYIGPSLKNVVILGETGTGKEEMAKRVHVFSGLARIDEESPAKKYRNFRVLNCGAMNDQLLLSQLFGHVKGAFTDAAEHKLGAVLEAASLRHAEVDGRFTYPSYIEWLNECARKGLAEILDKPFRSRWASRDRDDESTGPHAVEGRLPQGPHVEEDDHGCLHFPSIEAQSPKGCGGTLFLDEVADLTPYAQAALLRFLDNNGFHPLGYYGPPIRPKVRVIAATNREDVFSGREPGFRSDLRFRLKRFTIRMPPIRNRGREPLAVAQAVAKRERPTVRFADEALCLLDQWIAGQEDEDSPIAYGNYRSLEALVERAAWIAATVDDTESEPTITPEILKEAAEPSIDMVVETDEPSLVEASLPGFDERMKDVIESAAFLGEDRKHDPTQFLEGDGDLQQDGKAAKALRDLFRGKHGLKIKKLFEDPIDSLNVPIANAEARKRWQYLCLLGVLAAAKLRSDDDLWKATLEVIGGKRSTATDHARKMLEHVLGDRRISAVWRRDTGTKGPRNIGDFLGLLTEPNRQILASETALEDLSEEERKRSQFYWKSESKISANVMDATRKFLTYLGRLAHDVGLVTEPKGG